MMGLSDLSIRRPVFAWMLMVSLIVFGGLSFFRLGLSQLPDVDFPIVTVSVHMDGAPPEIMEQDVVDIIEDKVMSIEGVKSVTSQAKNNSASIKIEFDLSRNVDLALQDVQAKVAQAQRQLPPEMDPPAISKTNPDDLPVLNVSIEAPNLTTPELMAFVRDKMKNQFATVPGVGDINLGGYLEPNMRIWVKNEALKKFELAANDVIDNISNEHVDPPTGQVDQGDKEYNLRFYGEATTAKQFAQIRMNARGGKVNYHPVFLDAVARIEEGTEDVLNKSRSMDKPAVNLSIIKQRGSNAVEVSRAVRKRVKELEAQLPKGITMGINFDSSKYVEEAVGELNFTLILSALLTGFVCFMFLGSWSSTFNVLLAIPTSIVGAFSAIHFMGFTLNTFTLLALSLAIGIVVDDAIMVLENITRHREMGKGKVKAALDGSREITFAAMAASVSVIAIFLPVAFMKGIVGKFFFQFGLTMTIAVLISLLEALTLTPMRAASFKGNAHAHPQRTKIGRTFEAFMRYLTTAYQLSLAVAIRHKWIVIVVTTAMAAGSFYLTRILRQEFIPSEDQSRFVINVQTKVGSSLQVTDEKVKLVENFVRSRPEVFRYFANIGGQDLNVGRVFVSMKPHGERGVDPVLKREMKQIDLMNLARKELKSIPDAKVFVQDLSMRGLTTGKGYAIEFTLQGPDWEKLAELSDKLIDKMNEGGLATDINTDYKVGMPEIQVRPDRAKASERGVNMLVLGRTINAMIGGQKIGQYPKNGHRYDVRVKLESDARDLEDRIKQLKVRNSYGELVPLRDVVDIEKRPTMQSVTRMNRERSISVFGNVKQGASQKAVLEAIRVYAAEILPPEYHVVFSGSSQTFTESFDSLIFALIFGVLVAYMVLATQFNSFIDPITVLTALPFSLTGAFVSLYLFGQSLNIYSMIGLILLMGIAKKNSILLVDFTNHVRSEGKDVVTALIEACPIRLRPILMTSVATIAGAIPAAMSLGPGSESRIPMAITVIGGVIISTFFTLYLVPCVYLVLTRFENRKSLLEEEGEEEAKA